MNMKIPITLIFIGFCVIANAQTVAKAPDSSVTTGFATKGANVIQLTANTGPNSASMGFYHFLADRVSLCLEVNAGACTFNHPTLSSYHSPVWPYYTYYKTENN